MAQPLTPRASALVVDDEADSASLVAYRLAHHRFDVRLAHDGVTAAEEDRRFDGGLGCAAASSTTRRCGRAPPLRR
ncbi:MAG: hypothetical protein LBS56_05415 [Propionibacteriaceae bacterium]|jgi:hypothetical protein|nr:hypothetical protein [Propionibacteriaceae bacterium]